MAVGRKGEVMTDYIKREDAINAIERTWINGTSLCSADKAEEIIKSLPSADVVERKRGEWINQNSGAFYPMECSSCHKPPICDDDGYCLTDFCPNCGADMREQTERNIDE